MQQYTTPPIEPNMAKRIHTTLTEHRIEYDPSPELATFLTRLEDMISDPKVTEQQMIGVAYSRENPMLDHTMHPVRAMVTKDVFENPAYAVMADLLFRKRIAQDKVDVNKLAAKYTLSVAEAAVQLGVHPSAVRQAIEARRLASWMKEGKHFLEPSAVKAFAATGARRGPKAAEKRAAAELDVILGHAEGASLRVRSAKPVETIERVSGNVVHGKLSDWKRIVVLTTAGKSKRAFVIEPSDEDGEIRHPPFHVSGKFRIVARGNSTNAANEQWSNADVE